MCCRVNNKAAKREGITLKQGVPHVPPPMTTKQPVPEALQLPPALETGDEGGRHDFHLPPGGARQAKLSRKQKEAIAIPVAVSSFPAPSISTNPPTIAPTPSSTVTSYLVVPSDVPGQPYTLKPVAYHAASATVSAPVPLAIPQQPVPRSTQWHRARQLKRQSEGEAVRINKRHKFTTQCGRCKEVRTNDGLHHGQYYGKWWCYKSDTMRYQEWLQWQQSTRNIKKKDPKKPQDP